MVVKKIKNLKKQDMLKTMINLKSTFYEDKKNVRYHGGVLSNKKKSYKFS